MNFKDFKKKYGKAGKFSSKDIKKFVAGGGSGDRARQFLDKAKKKGLKVGGGAIKQAKKAQNNYQEPGGTATNFAGSSGANTGYSGLDFDLGAFEQTQGIITQNQAYLDSLGYQNAALVAGIRSEASKYVADAQAGASMYGSDRALDIANVTSAAEERYRKYIADQERASAYEVTELKGKYGLDLQNIVNAGLKDVAKISGEFGLEGEKVRGEYALEGERLKGATARDVAQRNKEAAIFGGLMGAFNFS